MTTSLDTRLRNALDELAAVKKELAFIESLICQCEPQREHHDYRRPADYMHAADCPVAAAQQAATDDGSDDNRRRLYIDGKGNGWISVCHDEGTEWVVPVQPEGAVEQDIRDIADETGSMREVGRCW